MFIDPSGPIENKRERVTRSRRKDMYKLRKCLSKKKVKKKSNVLVLNFLKPRSYNPVMYYEAQ